MCIYIYIYVCIYIYIYVCINIYIYIYVISRGVISSPRIKHPSISHGFACLGPFNLVIRGCLILYGDDIHGIIVGDIGE